MRTRTEGVRIVLGMESCRQYTRPLQRTAERCRDFSQGYAFFAYPWEEYANKIRTPDGGARNPRHPFRVRFLLWMHSRGTQKRVTPRYHPSTPPACTDAFLMRQHPRTPLACTIALCWLVGEGYAFSLGGFLETRTNPGLPDLLCRRRRCAAILDHTGVASNLADLSLIGRLRGSCQLLGGIRSGRRLHSGSIERSRSEARRRSWELLPACRSPRYQEYKSFDRNRRDKRAETHI